MYMEEHHAHYRKKLLHSIIFDCIDLWSYSRNCVGSLNWLAIVVSTFQQEDTY